jgi:hypothetical protein
MVGSVVVSSSAAITGIVSLKPYHCTSQNTLSTIGNTLACYLDSSVQPAKGGQHTKETAEALTLLSVASTSAAVLDRPAVAFAAPMAA